MSDNPFREVPVADLQKGDVVLFTKWTDGYFQNEFIVDSVVLNPTDDSVIVDYQGVSLSELDRERAEYFGIVYEPPESDAYHIDTVCLVLV